MHPETSGSGWEMPQEFPNPHLMSERTEIVDKAHLGRLRWSLLLGCTGPAPRMSPRSSGTPCCSCSTASHGRCQKARHGLDGWKAAPADASVIRILKNDCTAVHNAAGHSRMCSPIVPQPHIGRQLPKVLRRPEAVQVPHPRLVIELDDVLQAASGSFRIVVMER